MEQRIIQYVSYLKGIYLKEYDDEERKKICEQVLVQMRSGPFCAIFWTGVSPACAADPLYQTLLYFGKFCTDDVSLL